MKKLSLIAIAVLIGITTAAAQYSNSFEVTASAQPFESIEPALSLWEYLILFLSVFYGLAVIVLTFKLFTLCDNVKELTKTVKNFVEKTYRYSTKSHKSIPRPYDSRF